MVITKGKDGIWSATAVFMGRRLVADGNTLGEAMEACLEMIYKAFATHELKRLDRHVIN